jgi:hypothetical protein
MEDSPDLRILQLAGIQGSEINWHQQYNSENSKVQSFMGISFSPFLQAGGQKKDQKWPEEAPTPFNISTKGRITGTVSNTRRQVRTPGAPRHVENVRTRG